MTDQAPDAALPEASFLNFLSGLATQALIQFGEIPRPDTGEREANLPFARYTLEILQILREKSVGNCTAEEDSYFSAMLGDLEGRLASRAERAFCGVIATLGRLADLAVRPCPRDGRPKMRPSSLPGGPTVGAHGGVVARGLTR